MTEQCPYHDYIESPNAGYNQKETPKTEALFFPKAMVKDLQNDVECTCGIVSALKATYKPIVRLEDTTDSKK